MEEGVFSLKKFFFGSINRKIIFGFVVLVLLVIIMGSINLYQNKKIQDIAEKEIYRSMSHLNDVWSLMESQEHQEISSNNYLFLDIGLKEKRADYFYEKERLEQIYQKYYSESCEHVKQELEKYYENIKLFNMKIEEAFELYNQGADLETIKSKVKEATKYAEIAHEDYLEKIIVHVQNEHIEPAKQDIANEISNTKKITFLLIGIIIFLTIFIGSLFSRSISKPIKKLHKATLELEKGNFDVKVDIKTGDEIEDLGNTFNKTTEVLSKREEEHKQLEKAKTEFLSITSHELRSPMTPVKAQLQMLNKEYFGKLTDKQKASVELVERNITRLDSIIMDFLDVSRIEAARLKFNYMKTDLVEYINRIVEEMKGFMPEKKVEIISTISKLPVIEVDPDRIMQVLRNLINNGIKFCKENCKVEISAKLQGSMILFGVKDNGLGIAPELQKKIFEPFFQGEQTMYRKHGGTGLGLTICRGIVEAQGGKIWLESSMGKGSVFYFTVPLKPVKVIKPIRLLFGAKPIIEDKLEKIFLDILGPIGKIEFEEFKGSKDIIKENLFKYVDSLTKLGILTKEKGDEFRYNVSIVFGEKIKAISEITTEKLKEKGFIKKEVSISKKLLKKGYVKKEVKK